MSKSLLSLAVTAFILGGCSLIPDYQTPESPAAAQWPQGPAYSPTEAASKAAAEQGWRQFFHDPALQQLIQTALQNNLDLRVAALNIDAYRAQYRIQRADRFPNVGANASELISEGVVAMEFGAASEDLARICHAHPTLSEVVHEAALACDGRPLHF